MSKTIDLLNSVSKVIEKLITDKVTPLLEPAISESQHGFTKNKSAITQMVSYLAEVYNNFHSKNFQTLYLDFEKASDKVCHQKLLEKVRALEVGGNALHLFESYLFNRKQQTVVNGVLSNVETVLSGVPQGQ